MKVLALSFLTYIFTNLSESTNPVKMSLMIFMITIALFVLTILKSGLTWVPFLLTLLFTGGILIMFMILSTFHPNEKMKEKNSKKSMLSILTFMVILTSTNSSMLSNSWNTMNIKMFYQNMESGMLTTMILIIYFSAMVKIMKKEKNSMRKSTC